MPADLEPCYGCKALVPKIDGPIHAYAGASAGCWALFGETQARCNAYSGDDRFPIFRLMVDVYCSQHPGTPSRRAIQSFAIHTIALCCYIERVFPISETTAVVTKAVANASNYVWLDPPANPGLVTVLDVYNAATPQQQAEQVEAWVHSVWSSWLAHHATFRKWADMAMLAPKK
ncbi:MAG: DUF5946 family protein [Chloroflexia bacterium]